MKFENNPHLIQPHGNEVIWRYMGLDKFIDLIINNRLYFTNAANLTDKYEISIPDSVIDRKREMLLNKEYDQESVENEIQIFKHYNEPYKNLTLVNCWSLGRHESYSQWKIYLDGSKSGVAIRTTVGKLKKAIENATQVYQEPIYISKVDYRSYIPPEKYNRITSVITKRNFYRSEEELRLFILHYPESETDNTPPYKIEKGRYVNLVIDELIESIYISPFVANWFHDAFQKMINEIRPNLVSKITVSEINDV
jgi:hypothetical protein